MSDEEECLEYSGFERSREGGRTKNGTTKIEVVSRGAVRKLGQCVGCRFSLKIKLEYSFKFVEGKQHESFSLE